MNILLVAAVLVFQNPFAIPAKLVKPIPAGEKIMAKVNGIPIHASDVEALLWEWRAKEVVDELISYSMLKAEALKLNVQVTEQEALGETQKQLKLLENALEPGMTVAQTLAEQGSGPSRVFLRVRNKLLIDRITLKDFSASDYIRVGTMMFKPKSEQTDALSEAIRRADDAYSRLTKGAVWDQVLRETTSDPDVLKSQGNLGWRKLTAFPESVQKEMATLKPGAITKPAQTVNGIQFFRIQGIGKDAKGEDLESLKEQYLAAARPEVFDRIKRNTKIERQ